MIIEWSFWKIYMIMIILMVIPYHTFIEHYFFRKIKHHLETFVVKIIREISAFAQCYFLSILLLLSNVLDAVVTNLSR